MGEDERRFWLEFIPLAAIACGIPMSLLPKDIPWVSPSLPNIEPDKEKTNEKT